MNLRVTDAELLDGGAAGIRLRSKRPIIELSPDGELLCVRFNNRAAAPFVDIPFDGMAEHYLAYRTLVETIERPDMQIVFATAPGDLLIVDNTRVLNARNAFSGAGFRWLQGCYADKDSLVSVIAAAEVEAGEVENRV